MNKYSALCSLMFSLASISFFCIHNDLAGARLRVSFYGYVDVETGLAYLACFSVRHCTTLSFSVLSSTILL